MMVGRILSPLQEALGRSIHGDTPATTPEDMHSLPPSLAPQFVYRYVSAPQEPPMTHFVFNHLNIVVLVGPLQYLSSFFGNMAPDSVLASEEEEAGLAKALQHLSMSTVRGGEGSMAPVSSSASLAEGGGKKSAHPPAQWPLLQQVLRGEKGGEGGRRLGRNRCRK